MTEEREGPLRIVTHLCIGCRYLERREVPEREVFMVDRRTSETVTEFSCTHGERSTFIRYFSMETPEWCPFLVNRAIDRA